MRRPLQRRSRQQLLPASRPAATCSGHLRPGALGCSRLGQLLHQAARQPLVLSAARQRPALPRAAAAVQQRAQLPRQAHCLAAPALGLARLAAQRLPSALHQLGPLLHLAGLAHQRLPLAVLLRSGNQLQRRRPPRQRCRRCQRRRRCPRPPRGTRSRPRQHAATRSRPSFALQPSPCPRGRTNAPTSIRSPLVHTV